MKRLPICDCPLSILDYEFDDGDDLKSAIRNRKSAIPNPFLVTTQLDPLISRSCFEPKSKREIADLRLPIADCKFEIRNRQSQIGNSQEGFG